MKTYIIVNKIIMRQDVTITKESNRKLKKPSFIKDLTLMIKSKPSKKLTITPSEALTKRIGQFHLE